MAARRVLCKDRINFTRLTVPLRRKAQNRKAETGPHLAGRDNFARHHAPKPACHRPSRVKSSKKGLAIVAPGRNRPFNVTEQDLLVEAANDVHDTSINCLAQKGFDGIQLILVDSQQ